MKHRDSQQSRPDRNSRAPASADNADAAAVPIEQVDEGEEIIEGSAAEAVASAPRRRGSDTGSLGPSDSSDSGSDYASGGAASADELISDSDAAGTGERAGVGRHDADEQDISVDRVIRPGEGTIATGSDKADKADKAGKTG